MEQSQTNREITNNKPCHHCEGKGYIDIRDCSGEIQRSENCSFCEGTGYEVRGRSDVTCYVGRDIRS